MFCSFILSFSSWTVWLVRAILVDCTGMLQWAEFQSSDIPVAILGVPSTYGTRSLCCVAYGAGQVFPDVLSWIALECWAGKRLDPLAASRGIQPGVCFWGLEPVCVELRNSGYQVASRDALPVCHQGLTPGWIKSTTSGTQASRQSTALSVALPRPCLSLGGIQSLWSMQLARENPWHKVLGLCSSLDLF